MQDVDDDQYISPAGLVLGVMVYVALIEAIVIAVTLLAIWL